ncbi:unnamed protein product, partial [Allacma fusca]
MASKLSFAVATTIVVFAATVFYSTEVDAVGQDSCKDRCNVSGVDTNYDCQCNWPYCDQFGDCCNDYSQLCSGNSQTSCKGNCEAPLNTSWPCQCNKPCVTYGDCCPD